MLGFINVFKSKGITSHDVVNKVRKIVGMKQVGHGGTLDPLAEGVMVVAIGKATRLLNFVRDDKAYLAEILLGMQTDTDDLEGAVIASCDDISHITKEAVLQHIEQFAGKQLQVPPIYSAIKKGGVKLYEMARKGEAPDVIESREIEILSIETISIELPVVTLRIACSKGTYIRSIARDLGTRLGVYGCLKSLVRERSGPFHLSNSLSIEALTTHLQEKTLSQVIRSPQQTLEFKQINVDRDSAKRIANGQSYRSSDPAIGADSAYCIFAVDDQPVALMRHCPSSDSSGGEGGEGGELYKPEVVLTNAAEL